MSWIGRALGRWLGGWLGLSGGDGSGAVDAFGTIALDPAPYCVASLDDCPHVVAAMIASPSGLIAHRCLYGLVSIDRSVAGSITLEEIV